MKRLILGFLGFLTLSQAFATVPLETTSLIQYNCILSNLDPMLSYFIARVPPSPIPFGFPGNPVCHDVEVYGPVDDVLFPRLNQKVTNLKLWDNTSPYFYDNDGDGVLDINNLINRQIQVRVANFPQNVNWFFPMNLPLAQRPAGDYHLSFGFLMPSFMNPTTYKSFCLNSANYNSPNSVFRALGQIVSVDTEGLYMGERTTGAHDFIFINERELKQIWFYYRNGVPTKQTEELVDRTITFFIQDGEVFRLKGMNEISDDSYQEYGNYLPDGKYTNHPTHDHKIGCVPEL